MSAESTTPESAAMQLAIDPSLISLDQVISAIRSWQAQTDAQINTLLAENAALRKELARVDTRTDARLPVTTASTVAPDSAAGAFDRQRWLAYHFDHCGGYIVQRVNYRECLACHATYWHGAKS